MGVLLWADGKPGRLSNTGGQTENNGHGGRECWRLGWLYWTRICVKYVRVVGNVAYAAGMIDDRWWVGGSCSY